MSKTKNSNARVTYFRRQYALWLHVMNGCNRIKIAQVIGVSERTVGNYFNWLRRDSKQPTLLLAYIHYYNDGIMQEFQNAKGREKEYYNITIKRLSNGKSKIRKIIL